MFRRLRNFLSKHLKRVTPPCTNPFPPNATATTRATSDICSDQVECYTPRANSLDGETIFEIGLERLSEIQQQNIDEGPYGLKVLVDQPSDKVNSVDIVAIHGLNGHREETWTDRASGVNWLADAACLRNDIPEARVLSFGYKTANGWDVRDFASILLACIKSRRQSSAEKQRPIIFICHSLGGLVFAQVRACCCTQRNILTKSV